MGRGPAGIYHQTGSWIKPDQVGRAAKHLSGAMVPSPAAWDDSQLNQIWKTQADGAGGEGAKDVPLSRNSRHSQREEYHEGKHEKPLHMHRCEGGSPQLTAGRERVTMQGPVSGV